ncbi:MAG: branched-chain amino acid ABC transporter permease [Clostridia bacterium]|nr:branched-chain amino acid ABC transporter permease [Clostridia bacterium]
MDKLLTNKYGVKGAVQRADAKLTLALRKTVSNPLLHYLIFGVIMCVIGYIAKQNTGVIPYSWESGLARTFAYSIASVGFCLLMGYSGLASLGTGGFIGIGTYAMYYIMGVLDLPFALAVVVAIAIAALVGIIVGFISLRIEGIYLVILTLGLSEILRQIYVAVEDNISISRFKVFIETITTRSVTIYYVMVALIIVMIVTTNLINSPTGRAMLAMKNSTSAAQAMGISLIKYRLLAFVLCTVYAALSGVMYMVTTRSVMASDANGTYALITSLNILAAVIIGGYKSVWGAVFGTFIMYGLQTTLLQQVNFLADNPIIITFFSGILVIVVVMFFPGGVAQLLVELKGLIKKLIKKIREGRYGKDLG